MQSSKRLPGLIAPVAGVVFVFWFSRSANRAIDVCGVLLAAFAWCRKQETFRDGGAAG